MRTRLTVPAAIAVGMIILLSFTATSLFLLPRAEATTTVITSNINGGTLTVSAGDTLIINPGITVNIDSLTNHGTIIVGGVLSTVSSNAQFHNYGIIVVLDSPDPTVNGVVQHVEGAISYSAATTAQVGTMVNHDTGIIIIDKGSLFNINLDNYGTFNNYGLI